MSSDKECCVPGCKEIGDTRQVLHRFPNPLKGRERFNKWLYAVGRESDIGLENEQIYRYRRVCRIHFELKYQCRNNRLSNIAVPTLNLPDHSCKNLTSTANANRSLQENNLEKENVDPCSLQRPIAEPSTSTDPSASKQDTIVDKDEVVTDIRNQTVTETVPTDSEVVQQQLTQISEHIITDTPISTQDYTIVYDDDDDDIPTEYLETQALKRIITDSPTCVEDGSVEVYQDDSCMEYEIELVSHSTLSDSDYDELCGQISESEEFTERIIIGKPFAKASGRDDPSPSDGVIYTVNAVSQPK